MVVVFTRKIRGGQEEVVVLMVFTREKEKEEAVFTRESITKEDPPNAHQVHHRPNPRFDERVCLSSASLLFSGTMVLTLTRRSRRGGRG